MQLQPGQRLRSQVGPTEVIVVRPPATDLELSCGGLPMIDITETVTTWATPAPGLGTDTQIGKRYTTQDESTLEVLVTKPGPGTLAAAGTPLVPAQAKPLPSSD